MKPTKLLLGLSIVFGLTAFTSCQDNNRQNETETEELEMQRDTDRAQDRNEDAVTGRVQDDQELSTFSMGMTRADLTDDFSEGEGPFTVFAPNNDAYDRLSPEERERIHEDIMSAGSSTNYLVVERELTADSLRRSIQNVGGNLEMITMQGERLVASLEGDDIVLMDDRGNKATITRADTDASNGVVHVIDNVLQPMDVRRNDALVRDTIPNNMNNNTRAGQ